MSGVPERGGLLIDTNLVVLFAVGTVNRKRIEAFKRTRQYTEADFDLLLRLLDRPGPVYTTPHILAEVSNLTDLSGPERVTVRQVLKQAISQLNEIHLASVEAT